jgi:hypothetical protein
MTSSFIFQVARKVTATLIDWGHSNMEFDYSEIYPIPSYIAKHNVVVRRFNLFACRNLTINDFRGNKVTK